MGKNFRYVHIPAIPSEPIQELSLDQPEGKEVECLLDTLKAHFSSTHGLKTAAQLEAQKQALLQHLPAGTQLSEEMLKTATGLSLVENIALLNNAKDLGFVGVNMYVDDEGSIKGAAFNPRASEIATCCGKPMQVQGDAFISRIFDNEDEFKRLDFTLSEVSSSADWVKEARRRNEAAKASYTSTPAGAAAGGAADVMAQLRQKSGGRATQPATVEELSPAEAAKDAGNGAFKAGDFKKAVECYSEALTHDGALLAALNNRAMAQLKLGNYRLAEQDCEAVLAMDAGNIKALLRRASAREGQSELAGARDDLARVLALEPNNKQAQEAQARLGTL